MRVKNRPKLLKTLADSVDNPWEFVEAIASLEGVTMVEVAEKAGITKEHYYVSKNQKVMGAKLALKLSRAFEIDPTFLNRIAADYSLKKILETV